MSDENAPSSYLYRSYNPPIFKYWIYIQNPTDAFKNQSLNKSASDYGPPNFFKIMGAHGDWKGVSDNFEIDRDLSLRLKSLSPHQPPGWNDPYRNQNPAGTSLDERFVVEVYHAGTNPLDEPQCLFVPCGHSFFF